MIDLVDINENCISRGVADSATNIRYRCIKMKAKATSKAWDNKDEHRPTPIFMEKIRHKVYPRVE